MKDHCINPQTLDQIKAIHRLSQDYNGKYPGGHQAKLLDLMRKHIDEIEELAAAHNPHFLVETGDLMMLCFELLLEHNEPIDDMVRTAITRYEKKLKELSRIR